MEKIIKPLGRKAYGSIPHLPGSRLGIGDHHCHQGQADIATVRTRDKHDVVIVQEKLDGSCCSVAKINNSIIALGRAGYPANSSLYKVHHDFAIYVDDNKRRFFELLNEGERVVGEFLGHAVGTIYNLFHEPFVPFDLMIKSKRASCEEVYSRVKSLGFKPPHGFEIGRSVPIREAMDFFQNSGHGAIDPVEGAIWRVERKGELDFIVKYVRHDKEDGKYFPEKNNGVITYNEWKKS